MTTLIQINALSEIFGEGKTIIEIGCYRGDTTKILAQKNHIIAIDPYIGGYDEADTISNRLLNEQERQKTIDTFLNNIVGLSVEFYRMKSEDLIKDWHREVDGIFIDGEHTLAGVTRDSEWIRFVKRGGLIAFHDYSPTFPDIMGFIDKHIKPKYPLVRQFESLMVFKNEPMATDKKPPFVLDNTPYPIDVNTYDGSGIVIHPDIIFFPDGFQGDLSQPYTHIIAMTPYNGSDTENPSIVVSNDPTVNFINDNITNPIAPKPINDHNSDTDIVYKDGIFYCYYRDGGGIAQIRRKESRDLVNWSKEQTCFGLHETLNLSPAVIYDGIWKMWNIDIVCRYYESEDGLAWKFKGYADLPSLIRVKDDDEQLWHIDIQKADKYYALMCYGNLMQDAYLFWAESNDGINWVTYNEPVLSPSEKGWDSRAIYRSTFYIYKGELVVFYSGKKNVWKIGYSKKRLDFLLKDVVSSNVCRKE